jgi:hypothetical protein
MKEQKQAAVSLAILEVIEREGLNGVTHSKIARLSKVSRAWIYEYIGKEKSGLIDYAAEVFSSFFARVKKTDRPNTKEELKKRLIEGTEFVFQAVQENPVIIKLHFRFRGSSTPIGEVIKKYEKYWSDSMTKNFVQILKISPTQASAFSEMILTLRLGSAYRIATSTPSAKVIEEARANFSFLYDAILKTKH